MAKKITLVDDIDGKHIEDGKGGTYTFALDGTEYEIDLTDENYGLLQDALSDFIDNGRRASGRGAKKAATRKTSTDLQAIREWAAKNGHEVSGRGRIAQTVVDAYNDAN